MAVASLVVNPVHHCRTKHFEIDTQFVQNKILNKQLEVRFVSSHDQTTDVLTKPTTNDKL